MNLMETANLLSDHLYHHMMCAKKVRGLEAPAFDSPKRRNRLDVPNVLGSNGEAIQAVLGEARNNMHAVLKTLRTLGTMAAFGSLGYGAYVYGVRFGNMDPFAKYRNMGLDVQAAVDLGKVEISGYHKGKLAIRAKVAKLTMSEDRSSLQLVEIHDGLYQNRSPVRFASTRGAWNVDSQQLQLVGMTRVEGKDFDVQTTDAIFNRANQSLEVPAQIHGTLYGGQFRANDLEYEAATGNASAHLIHWQGKPPLNQKDVKEALEIQGKGAGQPQIVSRTWNIDADFCQKKGNVAIYTNAKATDGEVLLYAPRVEWDRTTDVITATGRVSYFSGKTDVLADKVVVQRKDKKAEFSGSVVMYVKAKKDQDKPPAKEDVPLIAEADFQQQFKAPSENKSTVLSQEDKKKIEDLRSGKNVRDYPLHLQAQFITYWYEKGSRHAVFSGSPVAKQDFPSGQWRMGFSFDGTYDGEKDLLELDSAAAHRDVRYKNSAGDMAQARKAQFSTKDEQTEDDEDLQLWDVSGDFRDTSGEDQRDGKKPVPAPGSAPPSSAPGSTPPTSAPGTTAPGPTAPGSKAPGSPTPASPTPASTPGGSATPSGGGSPKG